MHLLPHTTGNIPNVQSVHSAAPPSHRCSCYVTSLLQPLHDSTAAPATWRPCCSCYMRSLLQLPHDVLCGPAGLASACCSWTMMAHSLTRAPLTASQMQTPSRWCRACVPTPTTLSSSSVGEQEMSCHNGLTPRSVLFPRLARGLLVPGTSDIAGSAAGVLLPHLLGTSAYLCM